MLFLGCLFKKEEEKELSILSNVGVPNASNSFQWSIITGLSKLQSIDIINVLPVGVFPRQYKKLILKTREWARGENCNNVEIGCINLPVLKQFLRYLRIKRELMKRVANGTDHIIVYSPYLPFLKAVFDLNKKVKVTLIVTDLPEFYDLNQVGMVRKLLRKVNNYYIYKYMSRIDAFVLLTEQMKTPLKIGNRPYVVIEGIEDISDNIRSNCKPFPKKRIIYAGTLHYRFGIKDLVDAFRLIKNNNYELWICGSGEAENYIKQQSSLDKRIVFWGFLLKNEVKQLIQHATVLVNPRPNDEYTKYSFPSKTMEYLSSGKPVLMHKLYGIPDDYDSYLLYFKGNTLEDMVRDIVSACEMSEEERIYLGTRASNFIRKYKNNLYQAHKIIRLIKSDGGQA